MAILKQNSSNWTDKQFSQVFSMCSWNQELFAAEGTYSEQV